MQIVEKHGEERSPYASVVSRLQKLAEKSESFAVGPACVSRAIHRAIRRRRPRARYIAPFRTRIVLAFYRLLPTRWSDALLRHVSGLSRKNVLGQTRTPRAQLSTQRP
jgi:hypothetical protein